VNNKIGSMGRSNKFYSTVPLLSLLFFLLGGGINLIAYGTFSPIVLSVFFFCFGVLVLNISSSFNKYEYRIYYLVFSINWFWAGIAAIYANLFADAMQNYSDAAMFYEIASSKTSIETIDELKVLVDGSGAVFVWGLIYDFFRVIGFESGRYIGILINIILVSFSGVFAQKIARLMYPHDVTRYNRLAILFSLCGMFWLFSAIHLRDAFILFSITVLFYTWIRLLVNFSTKNLMLLMLTNAAVLGALVYIRQEFIFIPFLMLISGVIAKLFSGGRLRLAHLIIGVVIFIFVVIMAGYYYQDVIAILVNGHDAYYELASNSSSRQSLGVSIILDQTLVLRIFFGMMYLYIFPIPFWSGFQLDSAYHLFKSLNVLFIYTIIPLMFLSLSNFVKNKVPRTHVQIFILILLLNVTMAISGTSLEGRHLGAFYVPLLIFVLQPDLRVPRVLYAYKIYLIAILFLMFVIHLLWVFLKI
jgi:hypothetical protein